MPSGKIFVNYLPPKGMYLRKITVLMQKEYTVFIVLTSNDTLTFFPSLTPAFLLLVARHNIDLTKTYLNPIGYDTD